MGGPENGLSPTTSDRRRSRRTARLGIVAIVVVGLGLTALITWASSRANENSNAALLKLEVRQVAGTLSAALSSVQSELSDAVNEATATHSDAAFNNFVATRVNPFGFVSESLWQRTPTGAQLVGVAGTQPELILDKQAPAFFSHLQQSGQLQVTKLFPSHPPRIGYADDPPGTSPYIVYAESDLPANHRVVVPANSAFGQLSYALYLGPYATPPTLIASTGPTPIHGLQAQSSVAFGNATLTVVATPRTRLSSTLSGDLPWIVLGAGVFITLASAITLEYVGRRRRHAEELASELHQLHAEQRSIATTLQHALLPESVPDAEGLELAARYLPGADGVEVGGDWYDFVPLSDDRLVFVVGDVSGRGVRAASVMASLRFAGHAFAMEGHPPHEVLERLRSLLDVDTDGYFATVVCGRIDVARHELEIATAGHPPPVLCSAQSSAVLQVSPSTPIGVPSPAAATSTVVPVPAHSTILAYTDGLIERRGETLDESFERLERSAAQSSETVDGLLSSIVSDLTEGSPSDDVALIGIRWLN